MLDRAELILKEIKSTGAYSASQGALACRKMVAAGIEARDGFPCDPESLFMTDGASPAVHGIIKLLIRGPSDAFLVPIPQYPLYSAGIQLAGGTLLPYYLNEAKGWSLEADELTSIQTNVRRLPSPAHPSLMRADQARAQPCTAAQER